METPLVPAEEQSRSMWLNVVELDDMEESRLFTDSGMLRIIDGGWLDCA